MLAQPTSLHGAVLSMRSTNCDVSSNSGGCRKTREFGAFIHIVPMQLQFGEGTPFDWLLGPLVGFLFAPDAEGAHERAEYYTRAT